MSIISSAVIGAAGGLLKFMFQSWMDNQRRKGDIKDRQDRALARAAGLEYKDRQRAGDIKDNGISFTRRVLAFALTATLCSPVFYSWFYPDAMISVPQDYLDRTLLDYILPWREGKLMTKYVQIPAPVMAMPIYELCAMVICFYFGSGGSRGR